MTSTRIRRAPRPLPRWRLVGLAACNASGGGATQPAPQSQPPVSATPAESTAPESASPAESNGPQAGSRADGPARPASRRRDP